MCVLTYVCAGLASPATVAGRAVWQTADVHLRVSAYGKLVNAWSPSMTAVNAARFWNAN